MLDNFYRRHEVERLVFFHPFLGFPEVFSCFFSVLLCKLKEHFWSLWSLFFKNILPHLSLFYFL